MVTWEWRGGQTLIRDSQWRREVEKGGLESPVHKGELEIWRPCWGRLVGFF